MAHQASPQQRKNMNENEKGRKTQDLIRLDGWRPTKIGWLDRSKGFYDATIIEKVAWLFDIKLNNDREGRNEMFRIVAEAIFEGKIIAPPDGCVWYQEAGDDHIVFMDHIFEEWITFWINAVFVGLLQLERAKLMTKVGSVEWNEQVQQLTLQMNQKLLDCEIGVKKADKREDNRNGDGSEEKHNNLSIITNLSNENEDDAVITELSDAIGNITLTRGSGLDSNNNNNQNGTGQDASESYNDNNNNMDRALKSTIHNSNNDNNSNNSNENNLRRDAKIQALEEKMGRLISLVETQGNRIQHQSTVMEQQQRTIENQAQQIQQQRPNQQQLQNADQAPAQLIPPPVPEAIQQQIRQQNLMIQQNNQRQFDLEKERIRSEERREASRIRAEEKRDQLERERMQNEERREATRIQAEERRDRNLITSITQVIQSRDESKQEQAAGSKIKQKEIERFSLKYSGEGTSIPADLITFRRGLQHHEAELRALNYFTESDKRMLFKYLVDKCITGTAHQKFDRVRNTYGNYDGLILWLKNEFKGYGYEEVLLHQLQNYQIPVNQEWLKIIPTFEAVLIDYNIAANLADKRRNALVNTDAYQVETIYKLLPQKLEDQLDNEMDQKGINGNDGPDTERATTLTELQERIERAVKRLAKRGKSQGVLDRDPTITSNNMNYVGRGGRGNGRGYRGYRGNRGSRGYRGYRASRGYRGYRGNRGTRGYRGDRGHSGNRGNRGNGRGSDRGGRGGYRFLICNPNVKCWTCDRWGHTQRNHDECIRKGLVERFEKEAIDNYNNNSARMNNMALGENSDTMSIHSGSSSSSNSSDASNFSVMPGTITTTSTTTTTNG